MGSHTSLGDHLLQTIAIACMFLAGKVEETPRPLKEVIRISYEIIHKKDPTAVLRIKQKVFYYCCCFDHLIPMYPHSELWTYLKSIAARL